MKLNIIANKEKSKVIADIEEKNIIIKSDQEKISEVIYNFIDNALKYGSDNQTIVISVTKLNKKLVKIAVKNQGKGIPPEKMDQLFNKFSQLEPSLTRSQEGTGLGLYICKIIIDSLGGKIGVENEPNKGSTFYFTLPI
jgi:signal transduction histidine kinase